MALTNNFKEIVDAGKITRVKIMIKDSLLLDPSCGELEEMLAYAKAKLPDLMDEHDGEAFLGSDKWNENYLNEQMVNVVNNFSQERIDLLKAMVKKLYAKQEKNMKDSVSRVRSNEKKSMDHESRHGFTGTQKAGICVAAVGCGALVAGLATEAPVVIAVMGGVAIGVGAYMIFQKS